MKVGVLTAALQELTPREVRDADPDRAIEDWLAVRPRTRRGLHPVVGGAAPDAVRRAARGDARPGGEHAGPAAAVRRRIARACAGGRSALDRHRRCRTSPTSTTCCITTRRRGSEARLLLARVRRRRPARRRRGAAASSAATSSGAWTRTWSTSSSTSSRCCEAAKARGLTYRVEQCPMPGWTTGDHWHNNIAYTPGAWIALHRICEKHGVGDQFRIHYDPSHAILMGQDTRSIFQYLKDSGYGFLIGGFHVKGQVIDSQGVSAWGYGGQTVERGDWIERQAVANPADQAERLEEADRALPSTSCRARRGTTRSPTCRTAPSTGSTISWPRANCCRSTSPTPTWSSSTSTRGAHPGSQARSRPSSRGRSPSSAASTKRRRACTRCSTRCWRRRASRCRASGVRRFGASAPRRGGPSGPPGSADVGLQPNSSLIVEQPDVGLITVPPIPGVSRELLHHGSLFAPYYILRSSQEP